MTISSTDSNSCCIGRRAVKKGPRSSVNGQADVNEKYATDLKLLRCKNNILIATFNVRTLNPLERLNELVANAEKYDISAICIQEHRQYHDDIDIKYQTLANGWTLVTSSAWKNAQNATIGGVGILINQKVKKALNNIETISKRIMIATFNGNPETSIVSCYSPTNTSDEDEAQSFYDELIELLKSIPKHNVQIIGGDFNAKVNVGDDIKYSFNEITNRNGEYLLNLIRECEMIPLNTRFQKRKGKMWTFTYPTGHKAQIDYILISKKWKNSVMNCESYSSFHSVQSDHRITTAKIRLSLRANIESKKPPRYNWNTLMYDENIKLEYTIEVQNRFQKLHEEDKIKSADTIYTNVIDAHMEATKKHIPIKKKGKRKAPWESKVVIEKRQNLKVAFKEKNVNNSEINNAKYETAKEELNDAYRISQEHYIDQKTREIQMASENNKSRIAWQTVNEITGRKCSNQGKIIAENPKKRLEKWQNHFQGLLGQPPIIDDAPIQNIIMEQLPINTNNFTMDELRITINSLSINKACGPDNIPSEVWKSGVLHKPLLQVCNKTFNNNKPSIWSKGDIIPFPKKGNLGLTCNYRGITLTCIAAKIYNKMLLNRIRSHIEPILRINQNGFRPSRSTLSQILTLRRIIEGIKAKNLKAVITFIDFRKAFDSIHRGKMLEILAAYGIPDKIINAIAIMYDSTTARVVSPDGNTNYFEISAGVQQGDTLAPFLFIIVLDYAMRKAITDHENLGFTLHPRRSSRYPDIKITDVIFADDLATLSDTINDAETLLHRIEKAAKEIGLHINETKTEYMTYATEGDLHTLSGSELKCVEDFKYLGSQIGNTEKDMKKRIGMAWTALNRMEKIWKSSLPKNIKIRFFKATVESILLYGGQCWTLTETMNKQLDGAYTRMLRAATNTSWSEHQTNEELYENNPRVSEILMKLRLKFSGHCWRSRNELAHKVLLWEPHQGKRSKGRPATTFVDTLVRDSGIDRQNLPRAMDDKKKWSAIVKNARITSIR